MNLLFCIYCVAALVMVTCRGKGIETTNNVDFSDLIAAQTSLTSAMSSVSRVLRRKMREARHNKRVRASRVGTEPRTETPSAMRMIQEGQGEAQADDPTAGAPLKGLVEVLLLQVFFEQPRTAPGKTYYLSKSSSKSDIGTAESMCTILGGHLAEVDDEEENVVVEAYLAEHPTVPVSNGGVYISGSDLQEKNNWVHQRDGRQVTFFNWRRGQPDHSYDMEHCLEMRGAFGWKMNDRRCDNDSGNMRFLCEVPDKVEL